jgi:hypothetical protein
MILRQMKVSKSCFLRVLFFVGAFGVFLVLCRCFLVTLLHIRFLLCVCVRLGIFIRSYYVLIMGLLARSVV